MANFKIPNIDVEDPIIIQNFLGVDFTSDITQVNTRRSPDAYNCIKKDGYIQKRNGYKIITNLESRINGIWNIDLSTGNEVIVHSGTKLYKLSGDLSSYTQLYSNMADNISSGIVFNGRLYIFDGKRAVAYGKFGNNIEIHYLDEIGYIPTTMIAGNSKKQKTYEPVNMIQPLRINTFLADDTTLIYTVETKKIDTGTQLFVQKLTTSGTWETINASEYTVNYTSGVVTFKHAIGNSPVEGRDNLSIRYSIKNSDTISQINKCNIVTTFGYDGNNNRLFVAGCPDLPNVDWYTEANDATYYPDVNNTSIGLSTAPIVGYIRINDGRMAVLKDVSDTDCTNYYRDSKIFNEEEKFPISSGTKGIGTISSNANCVLENEPLVLTRQGIYAIISVTNNDERFAQRRSYYVDGKLTKEANLQNAVAIEYDKKYYLAVNNNVYIADSRYKSVEPNTNTTQYEWLFYTNIPVRVWFSYNNELYFGTSSGDICKFRQDNDEQRFYDGNKEVESYWSTPQLAFDTILRMKTIKKLSIAVNAPSSIEIGTITKTGAQELDNKLFEDSAYPSKIIRITRKIRKFMYAQIYMLSTEPKNMTFKKVMIEYAYNGIYRGD